MFGFAGPARLRQARQPTHDKRLFPEQYECSYATRNVYGNFELTGRKLTNVDIDDVGKFFRIENKELWVLHVQLNHI